MLTGFDFSHHNDVRDFKKAYDSGFAFAVGKATEGIDYTDPLFTDRIKRAQDAGLIIGAYHFYHPKDSVESQSDHFLNVVKKAIGASPCFIAGDFEWTAGPSHPNEEWDKLDAAARAESATSFLDEIGIGLRRKPLVYGSAPFIEQYLDAAALGTYAGFWIADYQPPVSERFKAYKIWQTSEKGIVPGVNGLCDLNRTELDLGNLAALGIPAGPIPGV